MNVIDKFQYPKFTRKICDLVVKGGLCKICPHSAMFELHALRGSPVLEAEADCSEQEQGETNHRGKNWKTGLLGYGRYQEEQQPDYDPDDRPNQFETNLQRASRPNRIADFRERWLLTVPWGCRSPTIVRQLRPDCL